MRLIEQINTSYGRFYQTPDGIYPSVTTVLASKESAPELEAWRNDIGYAEADRVTRRAAGSGTRFHTFCETVLRDKIVPKLDPFDHQAFSSSIPYLKKIDHIFVERGFWSNELKVAGTIDCFGRYDGKIRLIDFKTTRREKRPGDFDSYWLQTAAYAQMIKEHTGKEIPDLMILMQNLTLGETNVFYETGKKWLEQFIELRAGYKGEYLG